MSSSAVDIMQKKADDATVSWREYEALRDHLQGYYERSSDSIEKEVQAVQLKLEQTDTTMNNMQTQMTDLQASVQALTRSVNGLRLAVEQRPQDNLADDASVHGDNEQILGHGRGGGLPGRGRGFAQPRAQHVPRNDQQEDGLGKPKFSIPRFDGMGDVEDYLTWELKIEKLWRLHEYT